MAIMSMNEFLKKNYNVEIPKGVVNGSWFYENDLPMIVSCSCCGTTMSLPCALVDDEGYIYCSSCGEE